MTSNWNGYFVMYIFSFCVNLVSAGLWKRHLETHTKRSGVHQSSLGGCCLLMFQGSKAITPEGVNSIVI